MERGDADNTKNGGVRISINWWSDKIPTGTGIRAVLIRCGYCANHWVYLNNQKDRLLQEMLEEDGWIFIQRYRWICPNCNPAVQDPDLVKSDPAGSIFFNE